jgi:RND superfamily putative drug exporter
MGNFLHNLGAKMFTAKWWAVGGWFVLLVLLGVLALNFMQPISNSISIPGTKAQHTLDRYESLFPDSSARSGRVVFESPSGKTLNDFTQPINSLAEGIGKVDGVDGVITYLQNPSAISEDKTIGYFTVQLSAPEGTPDESTIEGVEQKVASFRTETGVTTEIGGELVNTVPGQILGVHEIGGVVLALVVLVVTLGSLVAAGLPIITALITVGVSMAGLFALSPFIDLGSTTPVLAVMLGLAVGIDYSLFIVNRYRTFVKEGYELKEAAAKAIATAGNAVLFAAATVVIALASLAVVQIPFMTTMGLAAAATVALAAIVAVTLVPAFLGIVGMRVFNRKARKQVEKRQKTHKIKHEVVDQHTIWYRLGAALLRFRKTILLVAVGLVVLIALPAPQLRLGLPTDETAAKDSSAYKAYELINEGFGPGYNGPLLVLVEGLPAVSDVDRDAVRQQIVEQYLQQMASQGVPSLEALPPEQRQAAAEQLDAQVEQYAPFYQTQLVANKIAEVKGVKVAQPAQTEENGTVGVIQVVPTTGPSDEATKDLVLYLRDAKNLESLTGNKDVTLGVTGTTAIQIDINDKLAEALPIYLAVVIGLSFLLLMVAFRSILVPLKATLGFLLSVFAMFGALVAVFQWGWFGIAEAPGPIVSFIPIIAIGILFGLAMDYEFFLVSGMQESFHKTKNAHKAVLQGYALGSRVVVAAGLIMFAVFAGFIGNHDSTIQSIGFALALGIFIDAFIVRMIIVPIIMSFLGKSAWWLPKWLDKKLPKISIEGEA